MVRWKPRIANENVRFDYPCASEAFAPKIECPRAIGVGSRYARFGRQCIMKIGHDEARWQARDARLSSGLISSPGPNHRRFFKRSEHLSTRTHVRRWPAVEFSPGCHPGERCRATAGLLHQKRTSKCSILSLLLL